MNSNQYGTFHVPSEITTAHGLTFYGIRTPNVVEAAFYNNVTGALLGTEVEETTDGKKLFFLIEGEAVKKALKLYREQGFETIFDVDRYLEDFQTYTALSLSAAGERRQS